MIKIIVMLKIKGSIMDSSRHKGNDNTITITTMMTITKITAQIALTIKITIT